MKSGALPPVDALRGIGKWAVFAASRWLGVNAVARRIHKGALPVLCYHNVVREPVSSWIAHGGLHLSEENFVRQMEHLAARYRVLDLEDAWRTQRSAGRLPDNSVALTFDDGYFGTLDIAGPVLKGLGLPATVFLATDYIEQGGWYWWDELPALVSSALGRTLDVAEWGRFDLTATDGVHRALSRAADVLRAATLADRRRFFDAFNAAAGLAPPPVPDAFRPMRWEEAATAPETFRFGGHGASHRVLDLLSPAETLRDARRCRVALDDHLAARAGRAFCYPEGRVGSDAPECLRAAGFGLAVTATSEPALERIAMRSSDPLRIPRIGVSATMTFDAFVAAVAGTRALLRIA